MTARGTTDDHDAPEPEGTPRWVVAMGAITLILLAAFVILHLAGGGFHGHGS